MPDKAWKRLNDTIVEAAGHFVYKKINDDEYEEEKKTRIDWSKNELGYEFGLVPWTRRLRTAAQQLGMAQLHQQGKTHRRMRPENKSRMSSGNCSGRRGSAEG